MRRVSLKRRYLVERTRIIQLFEILRRVKTADMIRLQFISSFGMTVQAIHYILSKIYFCPLECVDEKIDKLHHQDFFIFY